MASIFTKIIEGQIPCYKVAENEHCLAFLDINPVAEGHTLVIPKKEIDYIFDVEDDLFLELHRFSKKVAKAIEQVIPCNRVGVSVIGLEVPHAHIHLIPINSLEDMDFTKERVALSKDAFIELAERIKRNV